MTSRAQELLLIPTERGLFCPEGGFHIDPWEPVERAVTTHAHGDHISRGCGSYLCSRSGAPVLRARLRAPSDENIDPNLGGLSQEPQITGLEYGTALDVGQVRVTLVPAGHILGSAQVRIERRGLQGRPSDVWVVSGDYKTVPAGGRADTTCEPFEPVPCDVFITESTFGLPIYRWRDEAEVFASINEWWRDNAARSRTSIIFAYALGKAQRVLSGLNPAIGPIAAHGAVHRMNEVYRAAGVPLPEAPHAAGDVIQAVRGRGLVLAPPSALGSPWVRKFAAAEGGMSAAFASGWMQVRGVRRRKPVDRGFILSDHSDWLGLLGAIRATGAKRIGVTHGYVGPMVRWLRESGMDAFPVATRYTGERGEEGSEPATAGAPGEPPPADNEP